MTVTWVPLSFEEAQGFVTGYDISFQPSSGVQGQVQSVRAPGGGSEFTIAGLDGTVNYTVSVAAVTATGSGPNSSSVTSTGTYVTLYWN